MKLLLQLGAKIPHQNFKKITNFHLKTVVLIGMLVETKNIFY